MPIGRYIVVFKQGVTQNQARKYASDVNFNGGRVTAHYDTILNGFAAEIPDDYLQTLQSLQGDIVDYIEPDGTVTTQ